MKRIGIFGGTFDPPHIGHVMAAKAFTEKLCLDQLLIIPTYLPPHKSKDSNATPKDRIEMSKLAFSGVRNAEVSDIEIKRGGTSYTYITLEELYREDRHMFFLCGTDMFLTLDSWKNPEIIFKLCTICYIRRETCSTISRQIDAKAKEYREKFKAEIEFIDSSVIEMSSTEVREMIKSGKLEQSIDASVYDYICKRGLYK